MRGGRRDGELRLLLRLWLRLRRLSALLLLVRYPCEGTAGLLLTHWGLVMVLLLLLQDHSRLLLLLVARLVSLLGVRRLPIGIRPAHVVEAPATAVPCPTHRWIPTHVPPGPFHRRVGGAASTNKVLFS